MPSFAPISSAPLSDADPSSGAPDGFTAAAVAGTGAVAYTGTVAVVASIGDTQPETYSEPRATLRMVPRINRIGSGLLSDVDRA